MKPLKILFTSPGYSLAAKLGGTVQVVAELAEALVKLGHEVTVFATNSNYDDVLQVPTGRPIDMKGVHVWHFNFAEPLKALLPWCRYVSQSAGVFYSPEMAKALNRKAGSFDIIHAHLPFIYPTWAAARAATQYRRSFVYQDHGVLAPARMRFRGLKKQIALALVEKAVIKSASLLFALNEEGRACYSQFGVGGRCHVMTNGITPANYQVAPQPHCNDVSRWRGRTLILYFGQLLPIKGPDLLLKAFVSLAKEFPDCDVAYAGPDPHQLGPALIREAADAGFADRVAMLGTVTGDYKANLLARADVFCLPSEAEGFSISVLEALASATPVLLTEGCHFPQVVPAHAGFVVKRTVEEISRGLKLLLSQPSLRRTMGLAGRMLVERDYCWGRIAGRMAEVYRCA